MCSLQMEVTLHTLEMGFSAMIHHLEMTFQQWCITWDDMIEMTHFNLFFPLYRNFFHCKPGKNFKPATPRFGVTNPLIGSRSFTIRLHEGCHSVGVQGWNSYHGWQLISWLAAFLGFRIGVGLNLVQFSWIWLISFTRSQKSRRDSSRFASKKQQSIS